MLPYKAILEGANPYQPYNRVLQEVFGGPLCRPKLYSFHLPSSLAHFIPLAPFVAAGSHTGAFLAWGVVSLLALVGLCILTARNLDVPMPATVGALTALALITLPPIRENYAEGQLNVVVAFGIVAMWTAERSGRPLLAGLALGLAFALKPIPGPFFLYYAWRRRWRLVAVAVLTFGLLTLAGAALAGPDGVRQYVTVNYPTHAVFWPGYPDNASLTGFFTRIFGPIPYEWPKPIYPVPGATTLLTMICGVLLAGTAWLQVRGLPRDADLIDRELAAMTLLTLLVTPIVWPHYYVVLIAPVAIVTRALFRSMHTGSGRLWLAVFVGSLAVLSTAHWSEPYRGVGGLQLSALLGFYAVTVAMPRERRPASVPSEPLATPSYAREPG